MRYLAFIFSIYIMALSAWPCCGSENNLSSGHVDVCQSTPEQRNDSHGHPEACSPFFHTSTYHAFVISPAVTNAPLLIATQQGFSYPDYEDAAVSHFPGDIWQPPQWV